MNHEEIKKKYPKTWEKFEDFAIENPELEADVFGYSDDYVDDINRLSLITLSGYLFGFFDKQGIYINFVCERNTPDDYLYSFKWFIRGYAVSKEEYDNRPKAWEAAFIKAFSIIEEKLCNQK